MTPRAGRRRLLRGIVLGVLLAPAPGWTQSLLITATTVEDVAWSASADRLYAVLPAGVGGPESSVAELHPDTGAIVARVPIPAGPAGGATQLAVSDDGTTLYVGVNGGRNVRRYALPALSAGPEFLLTVNQSGAPPAARDLAVVPGATSTLVVAQVSPGAAAELAVYDNGVARPDRVYGLALAFFSPTQLLERQTFQRYRLTASGLAADSPAIEPLTVPISVIEQGVAYLVTGEVYDLVARDVRGRCFAQGTAVPAADLDRILYFGSGTIVSCAPSSFAVTGLLKMSAGGYRDAVRTGRGRVALADSGGRLIIAQGFDATLPSPPAPPPGTPWPIGLEPDIVATLAGCTVCRTGDVFHLTGTVHAFGLGLEVKAAIILPNGVAVAATALGTSHLVLRNVFPRASATVLHVVLPPGLPPGRWFAELALIDPASGVVWSRSTVPFEVQP